MHHLFVRLDRVFLVPLGRRRHEAQPLEQAARSLPDNPEIQYHLGAAYAKQGKRAEARGALERSLRSQQFAQASEARRLLDSLR